MKYCRNCQDFALYEDEILTCPICGQVLETYQFETAEEEPINLNQIYHETEQTVIDDEPFLQHDFMVDRYHGMIVDIDYYNRIYPFYLKLIRCLLFGEPIQFGILTNYASITIEEISYERLPERHAILTYYGDIQGQLHVGQEVEIITKALRRHSIASIIDRGTHHRIHQAFGISRIFLLVLCLLIPFCIPALIAAVLVLIKGLLSLCLSLLGSFMPLILIIGAIYFMIKSVF